MHCAVKRVPDGWDSASNGEGKGKGVGHREGKGKEEEVEEAIHLMELEVMCYDPEHSLIGWDLKCAWQPACLILLWGLAFHSHAMPWMMQTSVIIPIITILCWSFSWTSCSYLSLISGS